MSMGWRCGLAILSGVLDALGFIGLGLFPLTWIAKVPVLLAIRDVTPRRAFSLGLIHGTIGHLGGYYWMAGTLRDFAGLGALFSALLVVAGAVFLGLIFALLMFCVKIARRDIGLAPVWVMAAVYPVLEWVFPNILPYRIGASQYSFIWITQVVDITGLLGLTCLIGLVNGGFFELIEARWERRRPSFSRWAVPLGVMSLVLVYGAIRVRQFDEEVAKARTKVFGLVQGNHPVEAKVDGKLEAAVRYREMTQTLIAAWPEVEIVVWPESAVRSEAKHLHYLGSMLQPERPMITGVKVRDDEGRNFNAMFALSERGEILGRFDKTRLVPFSETIPLSDLLPVLGNLRPGGSLTESGTTYRNFRIGDIPMMPMICYEDILPHFMREMWHRAGPPGVLVNVTDDFWFGNSPQPGIHLALASFRAIESRRALVRSTATGVTAVVDPVGRIVARTDQWSPAMLVYPVPIFDGVESTFYLRYGDWLAWILLAMTLSGLLACHHSRKSRKNITCM